MLRALIDDLTAVPGVEVVVTRDPRLAAVDPTAHCSFVRAGAPLEAILSCGLAAADALWPIAPESGGILERASRFAAGRGVPLLGSSASAVRIAASKFATAEVLAAAGIPVVRTDLHPEMLPADIDAIVIKPDDGAGCLDTRLHSRHSAQAWWSAHGEHGRHVVQPYVAGDALSLSLLCADGDAHVLACNHQRISAIDGVFAFEGVSVNARPGAGERYAELAARIARALPGLWGYVGVDLIETDAGPLVVEVNPRLTTSYAGLRLALGINPAALVLALRQGRARRVDAAAAGTTVHIETRHGD